MSFESSRPTMTQLPAEEMAMEMMLTPGFHFLKSVPLWRSYTTMKLGAGSSTSCKGAKEEVIWKGTADDRSDLQGNEGREKYFTGKEEREVTCKPRRDFFFYFFFFYSSS